MPAMSLAGLPVAVKVAAAVAAVFLTANLTTTLVDLNTARQGLIQEGEDHARAIATSYYDGSTLLMTSGQVDKANLLQDRLKGDYPGLLQVGTVRSAAFERLYGRTAVAAGLPAETQRALAGDEALTIAPGAAGRVVTLALPMVATDNSRGSNCLTCHPVSPGTVLGAVTVRYSLAQEEAAMGSTLWRNVGINLGVFVLGIGVLLVVLRHTVINRLGRLRETLLGVESGNDLTLRVADSWSDDLGETAATLNRTLDKLARTLRGVTEASGEVRERSQLMARLAQETRERVERQQGESDQVAAAMNQMASSAEEVARNAGDAATAAHGANTQVARGHGVVGATVASIDRLAGEVERAAGVIRALQQESASIGTVVDVIKGIAEQTNMLALNAAIEAARAGEQGRGFAVVADEVRTLASRTQDSTAEIQKLVESLQRQAGEAVEVMEVSRGEADRSRAESAQAGEALREIEQAVAVINDMNTQIANAAAQQKVVAEEIDQNIVRIVQLGGETAASAASSQGAAQEMRDLVARLDARVGEFRVV